MPDSSRATIGSLRIRGALTSRPARLVWLGVLSLIGASLALAVAGQVRVEVGPFDVTVSARPSLAGRTEVRLAPLGTIELDTHDAPVTLEFRVDELRLDEAERIARDPTVLDSLEGEIVNDARSALLRVSIRSILVAVIGGAVGAMAASARVRSLLIGSSTGAVVALIIGTLAAVTFDANALAEPKYSGLLTVAPTAVGDLEAVAEQFGEYQAQLTELVGNVATLYRAGQGLPTFDPDDGTRRVLHVSDIHLNPQAFELIDLLVDQFKVDVVVDTGDITDWGTQPENSLIDRIGDLDVPYVWVRGNHDSGATQSAVASQPKAVVLDGDGASVAGLRFWGIGDPRYTPNKDQPTGRDAERDRAEAYAATVAATLAREPRPDVVLVHDARMASEIGDAAPLVLAGHTHDPREDRIDSTVLLVEGSTGGAGLRVLQGEEPEPLSASILYFDADSGRLVAYDRVTVSGLGEAGARIARHVLDVSDGDASSS